MINILSRKGFTLVEIMVTVAILGVVSALVIPNFVVAKQRTHQNTCAVAVRQLHGALELAIITESVSTASLSESEIDAIVIPDYIARMPDCPQGSYYTDANGEVHCTVH